MNIIAEAQRAPIPEYVPKLSPKDVIDEMNSGLFGNGNLLTWKQQYDHGTIAERIQFCEYWMPRIKPFHFFKWYGVVLIVWGVMAMWSALSDDRSHAGQVLHETYYAPAMEGEQATHAAMDALPGMAIGMLMCVFVTRFVIQRQRRKAMPQFLMWYDALLLSKIIHDRQVAQAVPLETWLDGAIPEWRDRNPGDVAQQIVTSMSDQDIFLAKRTFNFLNAPWDGIPSDGDDETKYPPEYRPIDDHLLAHLESTINQLILPAGGKEEALKFYTHAVQQFETKSTQLLGINMRPVDVDQCLSAFRTMKQMLQEPYEDEEQYIKDLWRVTFEIRKYNSRCGVYNLPFDVKVVYKSIRCWFEANAMAPQTYALRNGRVTRVNLRSNHSANGLLYLAFPNFNYRTKPTIVDKVGVNVHHFITGCEVMSGHRDQMGRLTR